MVVHALLYSAFCLHLKAVLFLCVVLGTSMWIQMNSDDGLSHAVLNVECVDDSADVSLAETVSLV